MATALPLLSNRLTPSRQSWSHSSSHLIKCCMLLILSMLHHVAGSYRHCFFFLYISYHILYNMHKRLKFKEQTCWSLREKTEWIYLLFYCPLPWEQAIENPAEDSVCVVFFRPVLSLFFPNLKCSVFTEQWNHGWITTQCGCSLCIPSQILLGIVYPATFMLLLR